MTGKKSILILSTKLDKQILKNCRPISLLPVCDKIFGKLLFNKIFKFFYENDLVLPYQSGFTPGGVFLNQLLPITHDNYKSFDCGYEFRGVFLNILKAFDKVWHYDATSI